MKFNLYKIGNRYYFRRKVPVDLQAHFGKKMLQVALGTSEYDIAKPRAVTMTAQTDQEFAELRGVKPDAWQPPTRLAVSFAREELENADEQERDRAENPEYHAGYDAALIEAQAETDAILAAAGMLPTEQRKLAVAIHGPEVLAVVASGKPALAKPSHSPVAPLATLRTVVPSWVRRNAPKDASQTQTERALKLFEAAVGKKAVTELTKADGATFVQYLLDPERGFTAKTASNHAACITALMNVAVKDDLIDRNPMDLTFNKTAGAKKRGPWTDAELKTIFSSDLFSDRMSTVPVWMKMAHEDARAALLMVLHSGVRIGEIGQLRRQDFLVRGGITAIRITSDAGSVKTEDSERFIPLADHLLADPWFAQWLAGIMGTGSRSDAPALPSVNGRKNDRPSDVLTKWFKAFREHLVLPAGGLYGTHKFRHWIRSALADKGVGDATADSITGHAAQGSSGRIVYTAAASLPTMLEALNRITYPALGIHKS